MRKFKAVTIAKRALEIAEAHPEKKNPRLGKYGNCFHFYPSGKPGCLFGHALNTLSITEENKRLGNLASFVTNRDEGYRLRFIQSRVDVALAWGEAIPLLKTFIEDHS